jgi:prefoldin subunit 5
MEFDERIRSIENNVQLLIGQLEYLRGENSKLKESLESLRNENNEQKNKSDHAVESNNLVKIAGSINTDRNANREMIEMLNKFVKELDKCIDMLND